MLPLTFTFPLNLFISPNKLDKNDVLPDPTLPTTIISTVNFVEYNSLKWI